MLGDSDVPWGSVLDALPRAVVVTDASWRILAWNAQAERTYGWGFQEVAGRSLVDVLAPGSDGSGLMSLASSEEFAGVRTVRRRDGELMTTMSFTRPVRGPGGQVQWIVDASDDLSQLETLRAELAGLASRLQLALDAARLGTWSWDTDTGSVVWDDRMQELFGLEPGAFGGTFDAFVDSLHPDDRERVVGVIDQAVQNRSEYRVEHRVELDDGSVRWLEGAGRITVGDAGDVTGAIGCTMDVTLQVQRRLEIESAHLLAQRSAEDERVNRSRFEFLAEVNDALGDAESVEDVVQRFVRAAVPRLGDWCAVHLVNDVRDPEPHVVTYHVDPDLVSWIESLSERYPYDPDAPTGIAAVIREAQPEFHSEITPDVINDALSQSGYDDAASEELRAVLDRLRLRSSIAVPLVKRGRTLGGITFATTTDGRRYTDEDLDLARAVAGRLAASIENRRLSDHQREIAQTLQASLLPKQLPLIPGVDVAVRYWAAGEGNEVGGDFYDLFEVRQGAWAAVIGDVCGKGPEAAALTGLARHTMRLSLWHGDQPEQAFTWLNRAFIESSDRSFLTASLVTLEPRTGGVDAEVTLAGHPCPVLVRRDGSSGSVGTPGRLLGCFSDSSTTRVRVRLDPGDTLVLFTDGISDLPPPHLLSPEEVTELIMECVTTGANAQEICDRIEARIAERVELSKRPDDVAVMVLRVSGADAPS